ncbi:MAG: hypothetical protein ACRDFT_00770 [bacterium]
MVHGHYSHVDTSPVQLLHPGHKIPEIADYSINLLQLGFRKNLHFAANAGLGNLPFRNRPPSSRPDYRPCWRTTKNAIVSPYQLAANASAVADNYYLLLGVFVEPFRDGMEVKIFEQLATDLVPNG